MASRLNVDSDRRFVQQQQTRPMHQGTGEIKTSLHSTGNGAGRTVGLFAQTYERQHFLGTLS
jgi:hypothetical protein